MPLTTDEKLLTLSREVLDGFDKAAGGVHPGFRPGHAKGILLTGVFTPSSEAVSLTRAPHLQRPSTPVTVRFSDRSYWIPGSCAPPWSEQRTSLLKTIEKEGLQGGQGDNNGVV